MGFVNGMLVGSDGRIVTSQAAVAPSDPTSGAFRYDPATGAVKAAVAVPQYYANGFPFNAGQLCLGAGPVVSFMGGLPFNALGQLVSDGVGGIASYNWGWPLSPGGIVIQPIVAPGSGFDPLDWGSSTGGATPPILSNSNRTITGGNATDSIRGTATRTSGKLYLELHVDAMGTTAESQIQLGICTSGSVLPPPAGFIYVTVNNFKYGGKMDAYHAGSFITGISFMVDGDTVMIAADFAAGKVWHGKNGLWYGTGNPATGGSPQWGDLAGLSMRPYAQIASAGFGGQITLRTGAGQVAYPIPSGFTAWG
jgi:hypothetical protein